MKMRNLVFLMLLIGLVVSFWIACWFVSSGLPLGYVFPVCLFGCGLVWAMWYEHRNQLQEKCQRDKRKSNHAAMSPQPSAVGDSVAEPNPGLVKLIGSAPSIGKKKAGTGKTGNQGGDG